MVQDLLRFLSGAEVWIYLLLGMFGIIYFRRLMKATQQKQAAIFGLERKNAQNKVNAAITMLVIIGLFILVEAVIVSFVVPSVPGVSLFATPTVSLVDTSVAGTPLQLGLTVEPTSLATPQSGVPLMSAGCVKDQIEWTYPVMGDELSGTVELEGTVNIIGLGFFKYEYSQPGSDVWTTIAAGNTTKKAEPLGGAWNTAQLTPGDYLLRLVVSDNQNQTLTPCVIQVRVVAEQ